MPTKTVLLAMLAAAGALAQTSPQQVKPMLEQPLSTPDVVAYQLRHYLRGRIAKPVPPATREQWTAEAQRIRKRLLDDVVFHGWPRAWVEAPPKFENVGPAPGGKGYRAYKLRYEIVPGFYGAAIVYEPEIIQGRAPAIVNVNGHVGHVGKAIEYKQKRCINQARQGIISLNLEWFSYGELDQKENEHWFGAHLDLVGVNEVGLFYLAMRKGLDYLYSRPDVDLSRIGVTGLSGGGWQTILLSALDGRVAATAPVAGFSSLDSRLERPGDVGDVEQNATDLLAGQDYSHLTAMMAPRPTLLVYNAEDDCCFRAPLVKPYVFDQILPFFRLYGSEDKFAWHENFDPGDHNYQLDNRLQSYRFFAKHFGLAPVEVEAPVGGELATFEQLTVGLPADNLTILGLARQFAAKIERPVMSADERQAALRRTLRYSDAEIDNTWALGSSSNKGLQTRSYRFDFRNGLSATGVWLAPLQGGVAAATIVLNDKGKKSSDAAVSDRVNRGERVLALDLLFTGDIAPQNPGLFSYSEMLAATGDRPLGLEAAQLISLARWLRQNSGAAKVRIETTGIRSQVVAQVAAALEPELFSEVMVSGGMRSLRHLLDAPVEYEAAADLFCLDLFKLCDLDDLAAWAAPVKVRLL
jgi:dienelactone hydrolase